MIMNRMKAIGLSMKSNGVFTRIIEVRSLDSMMPPSTMPSMMGAIGRFNLFRMKPGLSLLKISVFHFRRLLALFGQNNNEEQCPEAEDGKSPRYFSRG